MQTYSELNTHIQKSTENEIEQLSIQSGVPLATILKIKYGVTKNPRVLTVEKLLTSLNGESK